MLPENISVSLNQIPLYCVAVSKRAEPLCCNHQRCHQLRLNKGRVLGLHKLHLTTYPTGDKIDIFASVKI